MGRVGTAVPVPAGAAGAWPCQSPAPGTGDSWQSQDTEQLQTTPCRDSCCSFPAAPSQLPSAQLIPLSWRSPGVAEAQQDGTELLHPCQVLPGDRTLSGEEQLQVFSRKTRGNVCCPLVAPLGGGQHQLLLPPALQSSGNALVVFPGQGGFQGCGVGPAGTSQLGATAVLCHSQWMGCGPGAQCCPHPSPEQTLGILSQSQSAMDH